MEMALVVSLVALAALSAGDVLSTNRVLSRGGVELNPVVRGIMRIFGSEWFVYKIALVGACAAAAIWFPSWALVGAINLGNAATAWALWHNWGVLRRINGK